MEDTVGGLSLANAPDHAMVESRNVHELVPIPLQCTGEMFVKDQQKKPKIVELIHAQLMVVLLIGQNMVNVQSLVVEEPK